MARPLRLRVPRHSTPARKCRIPFSPYRLSIVTRGAPGSRGDASKIPLHCRVWRYDVRCRRTPVPRNIHATGCAYGCRTSPVSRRYARSRFMRAPPHVPSSCGVYRSDPPRSGHTRDRSADMTWRCPEWSLLQTRMTTIARYIETEHLRHTLPLSLSHRFPSTRSFDRCYVMPVCLIDNL